MARYVFTVMYQVTGKEVGYRNCYFTTKGENPTKEELELVTSNILSDERENANTSSSYECRGVILFFHKIDEEK